MSRRQQSKETRQPLPPASLETLEQINARAESAILELDRKEISLNQQISTAQRDLAAIPQARQERNATLQARHSDVARLTDEYDQVVSYAQLCHQSDREASAVQSVGESQKRLEASKQLLAEVERQTTQAEQAATKREKELRDSLQRWQSALITVRKDCASTEKARDQAREELGRRKCDDYKRIFKEKYRDPIKELERRRIALLVEKQQFLERAQEDLLNGDWYQFYDELVDIEHDEG
jgi:hypothetical protein